MRNRFFSQDNAGMDDFDVSKKRKDIISWAKNFFKQISQQQRLKFAIQHLNDALKHRSPRIDIELSPQKFSQFNCIQLLYYFQTSQTWRKLLLILSYVFMFVLVLSVQKPTQIQMYIQCGILFLYWFDTLVQFIHRFFSSDSMIASKSLRLYAKLLVIMVLTADQILVIMGQETVFRPFLVFRAALPFFFDAELRKNFESVGSLYKDIFVYILFYSIVIIGFALAASQFIKLPEDKLVDKFTENYSSLANSIFLFYVMSSYDSYPDNQLPSIQSQPAIYALFILFIFLNFLIFVTIPTSFLFQQFKQHYSRNILIDQIKHQHSLIIAFLALSDKQMRISQTKLISFLFAVYKNKIRYVGYITYICLKLNPSKRNFIQITQFMQLAKIIQSKSQMFPPQFNDWQPWLRFTEYINENIGLKKFVKSSKFSIIVVIMIILCIINSVFILSNHCGIFDTIDDTFTVLFSIQILIKIIGLGVNGFFLSTVNKIDLILVIIMIFVQIFTTKTLITRNLDVLAKIMRVYRIPLLGKQFADKKQFIYKNQFYVKAARLFNQLIIIFPIVFRFFPLFIITSYFLGVLGISLFRGNTEISIQQSPYSKYDDYSNFRSLLSTQFIIIQILVQAGWSSIVFDHAYRYGHTFFVIIYFVFCHICIVFVIASLLRGVVWSIYQTVDQELNLKAYVQLQKQHNSTNVLKEKQQLIQISDKIDYNLKFPANTINSRRIVQNKLDKYLLQQNIKISAQKMIELRKNIEYSQQTFYSELKIILQQLEYASQEQIEKQRIIMTQKLLDFQRLQNIQDLHKQDIQDQINQLSDKFQTKHSNVYITNFHSQIFCNFLQKKFYRPQYGTTGLNFSETNLFNNQQLNNKFKQQIYSMLDIKSLRNKQLLQNLSKQINQNKIDMSSYDILKQEVGSLRVFQNKWILRQTFLSKWSEYAIKKFQFEYLSQVYPQHFNKMVEDLALQPLLTLQAKLTHCLRNLLRYKSIKSKQFFINLAQIQNKVSSGLLKKGSIFKFVFQIQNHTQNWFVVQSNNEKNFKVHFLKNGLWFCDKHFQQNKIYASKDLFSIENNFKKDDLSLGQKLLKMLFHNFETVALSLQKQTSKNFFAYQPTQQVYDLFFVYKNITRNSYSQKNKIGISKIMAIVLFNCKQRAQPLNYELTNMQHIQKKPETYFKFDQSQKQTLQKLKKFQTCQKQELIVDKGLTFHFSLNFMVEIKDILTLNSQNFNLQVQRLLTKKKKILEDQEMEQKQEQ